MLRFILIACLVVGCTQQEAGKKTIENETIPEVEVSTVSKKTWTQYIMGYGSMEAANEINISVNFSAKVKKNHIAEGNKVSKGQILIEFEDEKLQLLYQQSKTLVKSSHATLEESSLDLQRKEKLFRNGNISHSEWDNSNLNFKRATANYEDALATEKIAYKELQDSQIFSPVDGIIAKKSILTGEISVPAEPFIIIQTVDTMRVFTYVSEKEVNYIRLRSSAKITSPGVKGKRYTGHVESIATSGDPITGNFQVKISLSNKERLLRPGMTAKVILEGMEIKNALSIPEEALVDRNRRKVVFVIENGKAVEVEPIISMYSHQEILIISGIKENDIIVTRGAESIAHNSLVKIKEKQ